jgi:hypothetical protein
MAGGMSLCVLGSLFAAFAPGSVCVYGLLGAGGGIFLSCVMSWIVTIRNWRSRNSRKP